MSTLAVLAVLAALAVLCFLGGVALRSWPLWLGGYGLVLAALIVAFLHGG